MKKTSELFEGPDSSLRKAFDEATQEDWKRIEKELVYVATYASPERRDDLLRFLKGQFQTILVAEIERAKKEGHAKGYALGFLRGVKQGRKEERDLAKKRYLKIRDKVETVFFLYLATFPAPRDALQKEIQDTIKDVVNTLKENVVGIINIS